MKINIAILDAILPVNVRDRYTLDTETPTTARELAPDDAGPGWSLIIDGKSHMPSEWDAIIPGHGDRLIYAKMPGDFISAALLQQAFVNFIVFAGMNYLIGRFLGLPQPEEAEERDPVYAFTGITNTTESGTPIPIVYGTHKVGGNYIETNLTGNNPYQTGNQYGNTLDAIVGISEGEIDAWLGVTINGNDIANYLATGVTADYRYGTVGQLPHDSVGTTSTVTVNQELLPGGGDPADPTTWTAGPTLSYTTGAKVNQVNLNILHYDGLVLTEQDGDIWAESVDFTWRYRTSDTGGGAGAWSAWSDVYQQDPAGAGYGDSWRRVTSLSFSPFTTTQEVPLPALEYYDIEARRFNSWGPGVYRRTGINWDSVVEVQYNELAYPGVASLRVALQADRSLNSGLPRIISEVRGRKIQAWTGSAWVDDSPDFNNPAWVVYDLLTSTRYGLGNWIDADRVDLPSFLSWADWCSGLVPDGYGGSEKRCTFDGVFAGGSSSSWDAILRVCSTARAVIVLVGDTIKVKYEYDRTPTQLFTMGNIIEGSWSQEFISRSDRPNRMEVKFLNAAADYQADVVGIDDPDSTLAGQPQRPAKISLLGITRESQALREARFRMNLEKLNQLVEFQADIDAVAAEPGDLILIAHDVPQWGHSGRITTGATSTTVTLDRDITMESGTTYEVMVRTADDNRETRTITTGAGTYTAGTAITIDPAWTATPEQFDIYTFGKQEITSRPVMVTELRTDGELTRTIRGVIYDAGIHDDAIGTLDAVTYSDLPDPAEAPGCLLELAGGEVSGMATDGQPMTQVLVNWTYPAGQNIGGTRIYYRDTSTTGASPSPVSGSSDYILAGSVEWPQNSYTLTELSAGTSYEITALAFSPDGASKQPGDCSSVLVTPQGANSIPNAPLNVTVSRSGHNLTINWDRVENVPITFYEVRRGATWTGSVFVGQTNSRTISTTNWAPTVNYAPGTLTETFMVKAVGPSGQYGRTGSGSYSSDLPMWGNVTGAVQSNQRIISLQQWPGTLSNMTRNSTTGNLEITSAGADCYYQTTTVTMGSSAQWRVGYVLQWSQTSNERWNAPINYDWQSSTAATHHWSGYLNPDFWRTTATVKYQVSYDNADWSDWEEIPETQHIIGGNYTGGWITVWGYIRFQILFSVSSSSWSPVLEEFYITSGSNI